MYDMRGTRGVRYQPPGYEGESEPTSYAFSIHVASRGRSESPCLLKTMLACVDFSANGYGPKLWCRREYAPSPPLVCSIRDSSVRQVT